MEYLKVGFLELGKSPKVIKKTETVEQEGDGIPPPPPPPSPSDVRNSDNRQQVKLNQNQVNGLVLRLLTRTASNVIGVSKSVTGVSDELRSLSEALCDQMINVNSKMDKLAEQLYHKLYDPMFDGECKCEKCK